MNIDVFFHPAELAGVDLKDRTAVVSDVLRASSTIVTALENGARTVVPVESIEVAVARARNLDRDATLLGGERDAHRIEGFDLGNSPLEYDEDTVDGRTVLITTTNGTPALLRAGTGRTVLVGCLLNVDAVARRIIDSGDAAAIVCAGREGRFALEDALCAGLIVRRIQDARDQEPSLSDAARAALDLAAVYEDRLEDILRRCAAGRSLLGAGRDEDVAYCARVDTTEAVPVYEDHQIRLRGDHAERAAT